MQENDKNFFFSWVPNCIAKVRDYLRPSAEVVKKAS
jgi:hypothetical protein